MTPELEKWIQEKATEPNCGLNAPLNEWVHIDDLRALLEEKVICNNKPVAYMNQRGAVITARIYDSYSTLSDTYTIPLYK